MQAADKHTALQLLLSMREEGNVLRLSGLSSQETGTPGLLFHKGGRAVI